MIEIKENNLLMDFANKFQFPESIKQVVTNPLNLNKNSASPVKTYWDDLSLADGYTGLVVFYSTLDKIWPGKKWDEVTHRFVLEIKKSLEAVGYPPSKGSLYSGTAGLCYALRFASNGGSRYKKMLEQLEQILELQIQKHYIDPLEENLNDQKPSHYRLYDLIQGIAGIGLYLLLNETNSNHHPLIKKLIQLALRLTDQIPQESHLVQGWFTPSKDLFQEEDRKTNPKGIFNMGLSHGITGILGFLSIALLRGVEVEGQKKAIKGLAEWLKSKMVTVDGWMFFQSRVTFDEEILGHRPIAKNLKNREAWCYGSPGVARTLYLAAKSLDDKSNMKFASDVFSSVLDRQYENWKLPGPTFCHGVSGLLLITYLMARDSKSSHLKDKVRTLKELLLNFYNAQAPFGFFDFDLSTDLSYCPINKSGLLTGAVGVWLTLLTVENPSVPSWYYPFMVDNEST